MTGRPGTRQTERSTPGSDGSAHEQPYTKESEDYRFDKVKPPTDPQERRAHGKSGSGKQASGKRRPATRQGGSAP